MKSTHDFSETSKAGCTIGTDFEKIASSVVVIRE